MANEQKTLPHDLEAEQSAIGCVLIDNDACTVGFSKLVEDDFYSPANKKIYNAIQNLIAKNTAIDIVTLSNALMQGGALDAIGGVSYLTNLASGVPSSANFRHYLKILKRMRINRKLITASTEIVKAARENNESEKNLALAEHLIFSLAKEDEARELTPIANTLPDVMEQIDIIQRDPTALRGLKTGFYGLDNITNGLQNSDLIVLAARPGCGKTAFSLNIAVNCALNHKAKVAIFNLEMDKKSLLMRMLCSAARVSMSKVSRGEQTLDESKRLFVAQRKLTDASIFIDDTPATTPTEILRKCMRQKRETGLDLVIVDYLGLLNPSGNFSAAQSIQARVSENSRMMKIMSKELGVPVILLSQLNRSVESRQGADAKPQLSDLRDSGAIEQDADIVMFLHREKDENGSRFTCSKATLIVAKHRNGAVGEIDLKWDGETTSYHNFTQSDLQEKLAESAKTEEAPKPEKSNKKPAKETKETDEKPAEKQSKKSPASELTPIADDISDVF
ncbi:MAG: replicative DNA helicase [Christensenellaceae bacterium]|jgi:replicative DNA helicase|nr:replicative DNA helicase [Christensenellaceae bacterium]